MAHYVKRFIETVGSITDLNAPQMLGFFTTGLDVTRSKKLLKNIMFNPPKDLFTYERAENFIAMKEAMGTLRLQTPTSEKPRDRYKNSYPRSDNQPKRGANNGSLGRGRPLFPNRSINKVYTPFNTDRAQILEEIRDKPFFKSCLVNTHPMRGNQGLYCNYH